MGTNELQMNTKQQGRLAPALCGYISVGLEGEPGSELARERPWQDAARGIDEPKGSGKGSGVLDYVVEVVAVIGMVKEVERLERKLQMALFTQLDVLGQAGIHVEV